MGAKVLWAGFGVRFFGLILVGFLLAQGYDMQVPGYDLLFYLNLSL